MWRKKNKEKEQGKRTRKKNKEKEQEITCTEARSTGDISALVLVVLHGAFTYNAIFFVKTLMLIKMGTL